jgi:hypothetical protein
MYSLYMDASEPEFLLSACRNTFHDSDPWLTASSLNAVPCIMESDLSRYLFTGAPIWRSSLLLVKDWAL